MSAATTSHPAPSLHRRALRNLTTLAAPLMLLACGTDPEPVPPGDTGSVDVAIDATDTTVDADTDAGPDVLHDVPPDVIPVSPCGPRPEVACQTLGCGDGEVCAWAPDACYASVCTCDEGSREWACISEDCRPGWACTPDPGCDGPDPSLTCRQTGCAPGFACVDVPGGCVPSSCSCGDDGTWVCTEDCGSAAACEPVEGACPAEPAINEACTDEGVSCAWGEECCCGTCSPSLVCTCASGSWACYATDACFIPSCEGRPCSADSDCEGGSPRGVALECVNGMCMDRGAPRDCAQHDTVDACDGSTLGCSWIEASQCPSDPSAAQPARGCYPDVLCDDDADCPVGTACVVAEVAPRCAWERADVMCDACSEGRTLCMPAP